jgi:hypothetical protein
MPKTTRDVLKRQVGHSYANLERAAEHLVLTRQSFETQHPELTEYLDVIITGTLTVQGLVKDFWVRCWGPFPEDVEKWRNTGERYRDEETPDDA